MIPDWIGSPSPTPELVVFLQNQLQCCQYKFLHNIPLLKQLRFFLFYLTFSFSRGHISSSHTHTGNDSDSEGDTAFYISEAFTLCRYWRVPEPLQLYIRKILVTLLMPVILKIKAFPQSPCDLMDLLAYKISTFQSLKPSYVLVTWFSPDQQTTPCRCECFTETWFCLGGTRYLLHIWR